MFTARYLTNISLRHLRRGYKTDNCFKKEKQKTVKVKAHHLTSDYFSFNDTDSHQGQHQLH